VWVERDERFGWEEFVGILRCAQDDGKGSEQRLDTGLHSKGLKRPLFACGEDLSHEPSEALLPDAVGMGVEPFLVIAAVAGG
jgi:hypothetical protein